jgi:hypothetical protein
MNKTTVAIMVGFTAVTQMIYGRVRLIRQATCGPKLPVCRCPFIFKNGYEATPKYIPTDRHITKPTPAPGLLVGKKETGGSPTKEPPAIAKDDS